MKLQSRTVLLMLALAGTASLQGCFPIIAAGVGTGVATTLDRRSYGTQLEDTEIEVKTSREIKRAFGDEAHLSTTSYNRLVLITGQVKTEAMRAEATRIAQTAVNSRSVVNESVVGWPTSLATRSNDTYITAKVKARLFDNKEVGGNHVKVVTEDSIVYLMGVLTEREANAAVEVARTTSGVMKVVRVFDVVSEDEARRLDITASKQQPQQSAPAAPQQ